MIETRQIVGSIAGLLMIAVRSFLLTFFLMLFLGVALAILSYWLLSTPHPIYGVLAGLIALAECVVVGVILGGKRAIARTLVHALQTYQVGSTAVRLVFGRLLGVAAEEVHGERGGWLTRTTERLPLAQAEKRLDDAIQHLLHAPTEGGGLTGWLRRRVQTRLLGTIRKLTLTRFREEDAQHGGVDLLKVQQHLGEHIDGLLIGKLRGGVNLWTAAVLIGLPSQILVMDYLVIALLK